MAKMGEGDSRWIVEDRADGANVNGWHWTEKDMLGWSKKRLEELLGSMVLVDDGCLSATATGVVSITGDANLYQRKKKLIPHYELEIKIKWSGEIKDGEGAVASSASGKFLLPYVAEENYGDEHEVQVLLDKDGAPGDKIKHAILAHAKGKIAAAVRVWEDELAAGAGVMKAPAAPTVKAVESSSGASAGDAKPAEKPKPKPAGSGKSIEIKEKFYCGKRDIYEAFTDPRRIMAFSQSPAEVTPSVGGAFSMFGGSVQGVFTELVPGEKICQDWRFSNWEDGYYSKVEITIEEPEPGNTIVVMKQSGIPAEDKFGNHDVVANCENGWKEQLFYRIKAVFGFGA